MKKGPFAKWKRPCHLKDEISDLNYLAMFNFVNHYFKIITIVTTSTCRNPSLHEKVKIRCLIAMQQTMVVTSVKHVALFTIS